MSRVRIRTSPTASRRFSTYACTRSPRTARAPHVRTHAHVRPRTHAYTHTRIHAYTHAGRQRNAHAHVSHMRARTITCTHAHTYAHTYAHAYAHAHWMSSAAVARVYHTNLQLHSGASQVCRDRLVAGRRAVVLHFGQHCLGRCVYVCVCVCVCVCEY
jgi:hypothetical protein